MWEEKPPPASGADEASHTTLARRWLIGLIVVWLIGVVAYFRIFDSESSTDSDPLRAETGQDISKAEPSCAPAARASAGAMDLQQACSGDQPQVRSAPAGT